MGRASPGPQAPLAGQASREGQRAGDGRQAVGFTAFLCTDPLGAGVPGSVGEGEDQGGGGCLGFHSGGGPGVPVALPTVRG